MTGAERSDGRATTPTDRALERLAAWLGRASRLLPALGREEGLLGHDLGLLCERGARLEAPLYILLCGGTGAGKSTLLNAIAGAEIAKASAIRPTTDRFTIYHHVRAASWIPPALRVLGQLAVHEREPLALKVLIDAPDFDSTALEHRGRLVTALGVADLVLVLATPEKYASAELYSLLAEHGRGRELWFALNRLDHGIEPALADDFRGELERAGVVAPRVLLLSAKNALQRKLALASGAPLPDPALRPTGDFDALERLIEEELTRARIRALKRASLDTLTAGLVARVRSLLPPDAAARLERLAEGAGELAGEVADREGGRLGLAVRADAALAAELCSRAATRFRGPLGAWQALGWALRGLGGSGASALLPGELAARAARALVPVTSLGRVAARVGGAAGARESATGDAAPPPAPGLPDAAADPLGQELGLAAGQLDALGEELGFAALAPLEPARAAELAGVARHAAADELERGLIEARLPRAIGAGERLVDALLNLPALAVLGFVAWRWSVAYTTGAPLPAGWFEAGLAGFIGCLWALGKVADALARRRARRELGRLADAASGALCGALAAPLLARARSQGEAVAEALAELRAIEEELAGTQDNPL